MDLVEAERPGGGDHHVIAEVVVCGEIEQVLAAGASPDRISFGNTIKKERDIARAFQLGIRLYAVDCEAEVEKIARAAPGSKVFCRILCDGAGAEWPLSRKFGCFFRTFRVLAEMHDQTVQPRFGEADRDRASDSTTGAADDGRCAC